MEEAASIFVGGQRVGRVGGYGVVGGGGGLAVHGSQAAAQGAAALHLHPLSQLHLVLLLVLHPGRGRGRGCGARVRGHVFRRSRREAVEVLARVRGRGEGGHRSCAGAAAAGVSRSGAVQARFAEVAHSPGVVVVGCRQGCLPGVQPGDTRAVDEVWSADLIPSQPS